MFADAWLLPYLICAASAPGLQRGDCGTAQPFARTDLPAAGRGLQPTGQRAVLPFVRASVRASRGKSRLQVLSIGVLS